MPRNNIDVRSLTGEYEITGHARHQQRALSGNNDYPNEEKSTKKSSESRTKKRLKAARRALRKLSEKNLP